MEYNKKIYESVLKIEKKFNELNDILASTTDIKKITDINKQLKQINKIMEVFVVYKKILNNALDAENLIKNESDQEMILMLNEDINKAKNQLPELEEKIKILLLPTDPNNDKNVIVEIRSAVGGDESSIFVADLFDMYKRYSDSMNWKFKIIETCPQAHGYNFVSFSVSGEDVYSRLKFESGVHRVQRIPATEAKGRVHTSTVTVAVLPEQDDIEIQINPSDLRIDTYRASGAGGQHVNRTESAVRITHIPTNIVASCQEGKSQIENRETAMKMLRSKLWQAAEEAKIKEQSDLRSSQVGTGERSEKIRTYNYPQNRVTDHRIGLTLNKLDIIIMGSLDEIIDALIANEQANLMANLDV